MLGGQQAANPVDLNTIDLGTTLTAAGQDPTQAPGTALPNNLLRSYRGYSNIQIQWGRFHRTFHSVQTSFQRRLRNGLSLGVNWTYTLSDRGNTGLPAPQLRIDHHADGTYAVRPDQATAEELFGDLRVLRHLVVANFVWTLPGIKTETAVRRLIGQVANGWQLSGVFRLDSGAPYDVSYTYQTGGGANLTGSPDYAARVVIAGDPGSGCSSDQYRQFNTAAFSGPRPGSVGLESGRNILHGCGDHRLDLSLQRGFKIFRGKQLVLRLDLFNALDTIIFNSRNATVQFTNPTDQTITNPQYLSSGTSDPARSQPFNAGFGAAMGALGMRSVQMQMRLKF